MRATAANDVNTRIMLRKKVEYECGTSVRLQRVSTNRFDSIAVDCLSVVLKFVFFNRRKLMLTQSTVFICTSLCLVTGCIRCQVDG